MTKKKKEAIKDFALFMIAPVVCAVFAYWWQVYQGSEDVAFNVIMAGLGFSGGAMLSMMGDN